jgi:hypothetical protein
MIWVPGSIGESWLFESIIGTQYKGLPDPPKAGHEDGVPFPRVMVTVIVIVVVAAGWLEDDDVLDPVPVKVRFFADSTTVEVTVLVLMYTVTGALEVVAVEKVAAGEVDELLDWAPGTSTGIYNTAAARETARKTASAPPARICLRYSDNEKRAAGR